MSLSSRPVRRMAGSILPGSLVEDGYEIRTIQELLGHKEVSTTLIYTQVFNRGGRAVRSPADRLGAS